MNKFPDKRLRDAVDEADGAEILTDYSGRMMYGETCLAVTVDWAGTLSLIAYELGVSDTRCCDDLGWQLLRDAQMDSMGRGLVMYFPGWRLDDDE